MPDIALMHRGAVRWSVAAALLVVSGGLAVSQALRPAERRDRIVIDVLGGDQATLASSLYEGRTGLAIRLDAAQRAILMRLLTVDPLDGTAIALAALDREAQGDAGAAQALATQALRTQPRTRLAWLARLDREMRGRRTTDATASALRLLEVDPQRFAAYLPILATLTRDRRSLPLIAAALRRVPIWRTPFLSLLAGSKVDPAIRYALMNPDGRAERAGTAGDSTAFVSDLVARGDYDRAYLAWLSFLPDTALSGAGTPYDATFAGLPGPAPFNWQLSTLEGERASLTNGNLEVSYSGRTVVDLASQTVLLPPGGYRLSSVLAQADGQGPGSTGTSLTWRVSCLPGSAPLVDLVLDARSVGKPQQSAAFAVTEKCPAVMLTLLGTASEFPVRLDMRIASVALQTVAVIAAVPTPAPAPPPAISSPQPTALP